VPLLIDARQVPTGSRIAADLCVIGAGAAGISIALQFIGKPFKLILLESGGMKPDPATQSLYAGEVVGLPCIRPDISRSRFFGGSTNCWGGWCRPLDEIDMESRPWIPNSGWPITPDELQPYYQRTHDLLKLGPFEYTKKYWDAKLASDSTGYFFPLKGDRLSNIICQLSPPARFAQLYGGALKAASNIDVYLNANVTELDTDHAGNSVVAIKVASLDGGRFVVTPRTVTLCAGGIENARLLLASNRVRRSGIGNEHDVVGRYFMDHPGTRKGKLRLTSQKRYRNLYDNSLANKRRHFNLPHSDIAAHVAPSQAVQREESLPNSRTYLVAQYFQSMSTSYKALKQIRQTLSNRQKFGVPLSEAIKEVKSALPVLLRQAPQLAISILDNRWNPAFLLRSFQIETIIEPVPNPDSRITLSSALDRLGMPISKIDWRLTELDARNFRKVDQLVTGELQKEGLITLLDEERHVGQEWPASVEGIWHHMGTTRMHTNPSKGVVDSHCRVHGMSNLFVGGSSVFPTAGSDTPTITIVALALRLAKHLEAQLAQQVLTAFIPRQLAQI
jgi:choline dehydrogenase-like flavoprotein